MSSAVTSFCRSTKCGPPEKAPRRAGTANRARSGLCASTGALGASAAPSPNPASRAASAPAVAPWTRHSASPNAPLHAPRGPCGLGARPGPEAGERLVPDERAACLRPQRHRRIPPPRDRNGVATQRPRGAADRRAIRVQRRDRAPAQRVHPPRCDDCVSPVDRDARPLGLRPERSRDVAAHVDDLNRCSRRTHVQRGAIGTVVVGEHRDFAPRQDAEPIEVGGARPLRASCRADRCRRTPPGVRSPRPRSPPAAPGSATTARAAADRRPAGPGGSSPARAR